MVKTDTMEKERFRQPHPDLWDDCRHPTVEVTPYDWNDVDVRNARNFFK